MNNVATRTVSGIAFIIVMLACLMFNKYLFAGLMVFIMSVMLLEFYNITMGHSYTFSKVLAIIAGVFLFGIMFAASSYHIPMRLIALAMIPVFIVMINSLYVKDKEEYGKFSNIYTGLLYIAIPIALGNVDQGRQQTQCDREGVRGDNHGSRQGGDDRTLQGSRR